MCKQRPQRKGRRVKATVQVQIDGDAVRNLVRQVAQHILRDAERIDVKPSRVGGRVSRTEVIVQLPSLDHDQAQDMIDGMLKYDILLMFEKNKEFNNAGRTEIHVPAVRCLTQSHQALLGKVDENGDPPPGSCTDGFKLRDEAKAVVRRRSIHLSGHPSAHFLPKNVPDCVLLFRWVWCILTAASSLLLGE